MTGKMQAVLIDAPGGPEGLGVAEAPIPEPGPGEIRLKVAYSSMNPMDVFARQGTVSWLPIKWPFIPGIEHAGVVDKVGDGVDAGMIGKRYHSRNMFGGNAEYSISPLSNAHPMPDGLDWKTGTCYGGMTYTSYHALHTAARIRPTDWCLFHSAAGPIGIMLTQIAKDAGAKVIGLCSGGKIDYARQYGADYLIDYTTGDWVTEVKKITDGQGADIIVDGNQGPDAPKNYEVIAPGGHCIYVGATAGSPAPEIPVSTLIFKSAFVGGFNLPLLETRGARDNADVLRKVIDGTWKVPISEEVTLDDVPDLHRRFAARQVKGRAVIRVGGELNWSK
ncbi:MAG: zinc-binding alcohol dehydrogenase family protein [Proteobacteria bacterium]|nr:zinc-binding alcohol dehydrogenase family protein [Pseudomonadota bacterium]MDA1058638.1 zinc-binding alcohol dehydrogenase family protein [Pseudomonadota bacterium]